MTRNLSDHNAPHTDIEDIAAIGPELNDEELEFVAGGLRSSDPGHSSKTYWADGCSDGVDADF